MDNKRKFSRIDFITAAQVAINEELYDCEIVNLSLQGALLKLPKDHPLIALDSRCKVIFMIDGSSLVPQFVARVMHTCDHKIGLKFIEEDIESLAYLRRLLEFNLGDAETVSNELEALIEKN